MKDITNQKKTDAQAASENPKTNAQVMHVWTYRCNRDTREDTDKPKKPLEKIMLTKTNAAKRQQA